jgi:hypothetical protein
MGIFRPVVQPTPSFLAISNDYSRAAIAFHRLRQESHGCFAIPLLGDKCLKHFAFVVNCTSKTIDFTIDPHENLIEMPSPLWKLSHQRRVRGKYLRHYAAKAEIEHTSLPPH